MEPVKIDNSLLHSHFLWKSAPDCLKNIFDRDSDEKNPFVNKQIDCIDVDKAEINRIKGTEAKQEKTVDSVIGIGAIKKEQGNDNTRQLMLVELRMRYESINQVKFKDWKSKVLHTLDLLGRDIQIRPQYWFVFTDSFYNLVLRKWRDSSKADKELKSYIPLSVSDFYDSCCLPVDWEPILSVDKDVLEMELMNALSSKSLHNIMKSSDYWKKKAGEYAVRNRRQEVKLIKDTFVMILNNAVQSNHEQKDWLELIIDDFQ